MSNQLIFPAQTLSVKELVRSLDGKIKKIYFQCELVSVSNNDIICQVVAYAARRNYLHQWVIGKKVTAQIDSSKPVKSLALPIALANCEWSRTNAGLKKPGETNAQFKERKIQTEGIKKIHRLSKTPTLLNNIKFSFTAGKTSNPHMEYSVTLDSGDGTTYTSDAKPSPPAPPSA